MLMGCLFLQSYSKDPDASRGNIQTLCVKLVLIFLKIDFLGTGSCVITPIIYFEFVIDLSFSA